MNRASRRRKIENYIESNLLQPPPEIFKGTGEGEEGIVKKI